MSNPAVIKLAQGNVGKSKVWLDDNFGESIHLHIDDYRVDLTVEEFSTLYSDVCDILNNLVNVENLDFRNIDPVFLSLYLWERIPSIVSANIDYIFLEELMAPHNSSNKIYKLSESVGVRALKGDTKESYDYRESHHISQTERERMSSVLQSIKLNGYPYKNQYVIVFGDDNIIRDGQHRASCLYFLNGNIQIPVLRIGFKDYKSPNIHKYYNSFVFRKFRLLHSYFSKFYLYLIDLIISIKIIVMKILRKLYRFFNKSLNCAKT